MWTLACVADSLAEHTGIRGAADTVRMPRKAVEMVLSRPPHILRSPTPEDHVKKPVGAPHDGLKPDVVLYYADACNHSSWMPTFQAMGSPTGPHVRMPTPGQPTKRSGIGRSPPGWGDSEAHQEP
jgi:hypothetical protein